MKQQIKSVLSKIIAPIAIKLGYHKIISHSIEDNSGINGEYNRIGLLQNFYTTLQKINFTPKHIVDVGANIGVWTSEALKYFPEAYYTLFEPQEQMQVNLTEIHQKNPKVSFYSLGVGSKAGKLMFTILDRDDSCSFIFSEEEARKLGFEQIEIPVITLNEFLPDLYLPVPDIIKIDAEGLDLEVLKGADHFFGITEIFMVEAGVMNKFFDNSVLKVMIFMDQKGYRLFELTDLNRTPKYSALWLVELVFIKKEGIIDNAINTRI